MIEPSSVNMIIGAVHAAASVSAFALYGVDKRAAREGSWRVPESTLHVLGLLGGWPGALMAQRVFRHKTRKRSFRRVFWLTVVLDCLALAAWFTVSGPLTPVLTAVLACPGSVPG